ncbi:MAG TPA: hypothetical protein VGH44_05850 [Candidatus Saccharimonadia bacterium]|jgi:hypothetical protein
MPAKEPPSYAILVLERSHALLTLCTVLRDAGITPFATPDPDEIRAWLHITDPRAKLVAIVIGDHVHQATQLLNELAPTGWLPRIAVSNSHEWLLEMVRGSFNEGCPANQLTAVLLYALRLSPEFA